MGFFNFENKAPGFISKCVWVHFKVSRGSIESAPWFIWRRINWTLVHSQLNHDSLWNEPWRTLKWTQGPYFQSWKNPKKISVKKTKTKTGEAINLKIYLLVYGQKLIFNLGIPLMPAAKKPSKAPHWLQIRKPKSYK